MDRFIDDNNTTYDTHSQQNTSPLLQTRPPHIINVLWIFFFLIVSAENEHSNVIPIEIFSSVRYFSFYLNQITTFGHCYLLFHLKHPSSREQFFPSAFKNYITAYAHALG